MKFSTFERKIKLIIKTLNQNLKTTDSLLTDGADISEDKQQQALSLYESTTTKYSDFESSLSNLFNDKECEELASKDEESLGIISSEVEELVINLKSKLRPLLPKANDKEKDYDNQSLASATQKPPVSHIRLPKLQLKTFDGNASQWIVFYNLFESTVHKNNNLSDIEKFQYLLSSLQGEALTLVKSLPLSNENYSVAYNALVKRYHNPRVLQTYHLNQIIDIQSCNENNVNDVRTFVSKFHEHSSALSSIGVIVTEDNPVLLTILLRKFSLPLRTRFETKRVDNTTMPTPKEFIDFLENECSHMENANLSQSSTTLRSNTNKPFNNSKLPPQHFKSRNITFTAQSSESHCNYCKNDHFIFRCPKFVKLSPAERLNFVKMNELCVNCLNRTHRYKDCNSKYLCKQCGNKHHTLLHLNERTSNKQTFHNKKGNSHFDPLKPSESHYSKQYTPTGSSQAAQGSCTSQDNATLLSLNDNTHGHNNPSHYRPQQPSYDSNPAQTFHTMKADTTSQTILGTALVKLTTSSGHSTIVRALIDSASNKSLITEDIAQKLCLKRHFSKHVSEINGLSSTPVRTKGSAYVNLYTLGDQVVQKELPVLILSKISNELPCAKIPSSVRENVTNFCMADNSFDKPGPIQMILGADMFMEIIRPNKLSLGENMPYILDTVFGFVVIGRLPPSIHNSNSSNTSHLSTFLSINEEQSLHKLVTNFWQIEQPPEVSHLTPDEIECERYFIQTHTRCPETKKYTVCLPFKESPTELGQSFSAAERRFFTLENKLKNDLERKALYKEAMDDYISSGHMSVCENVPQNSPHYFIPHLGVYKDTSSTTRLRVVFDASCKTSSGKSLNDILHVGPKLHNDISSVIINFRIHPYVFTTDVKQMFRSIDLHEKDRQYQLVLWRDDPSKQLQIYKMHTISFGLTSSPYLANRVIKQLCIDERENHPLATEALKDHLYVDDIALGCSSLPLSLSLQQDLIKLLQKGNFHLRKWTANHKDLLVNIPPEHQEQPVSFRAPNEPLISVLGLQWIPSSDTFTFQLKLPDRCQSTKRSVLSTISQIWDPCGLVAPVTLFAKSLMQTLWTLGLEWDLPLPNDLSYKWLTFLQELPMLEKLQLPRYLQLANAVNIELHGFCDASETAYAACVYIRSVDREDNVNVSLVLAKTKVAPLKTISLPRLELCGAYLLAQLLNYCTSLLCKQIQINSIYAWSDSTVVLSWIRTEPYKLKTYVANRISQIQEWLPTSIWCHVPSAANPADCASRGLFPSQLVNHKLWWSGPEWLWMPQLNWPKNLDKAIDINELPEVKQSNTNVLLLSEKSSSEWDLLNKFSSWQKLQRVMCFVLRFIHNCKSTDKRAGFLTVAEMESATNIICRLVQQTAFPNDRANLLSGKECSNLLQRLSPFIDSNGVMKVGGRLRHSKLSENAKTPILLPKSHFITELIIDHFHKMYLHAGPQLLHSVISKQFWIISARGIIRSRIHKCLSCFKNKPTILNPKMGDLPSERVTPSSVFAKVGIDYAGPFNVKIHTLRRAQVVKAYLCIFVCFATKALHLEVACDMSTDTFMAALHRFVARRGLPSDIYVDNGANFVGASNQLNKVIKNLLRQEDTKAALNSFSHKYNIVFHFNPPAAPHQGGLWESAVKSTKQHLKRVIGVEVLTLEGFNTLVTRIEGILNSRPLYGLSNDPSEIDALTPGHFLIGRPLTSLPEQTVEETPLNYLKRWQRVQALVQRFWRRWQSEYLHTLQQRYKWARNKTNLNVGDLVLLHEQNTPPQTWSLGRISKVFPGKDNVVRVVEVKTAKGSFTRPVVKVSPLPCN